MKTLLAISEEILTKLKESGDRVSDFGHMMNEADLQKWIFYRTFSGVNNCLGYYHIRISKHRETKEVIIEVIKTTKYPSKFVRIIKAIEPEAKVTYFKKVTKYETHYA